MSEGYSIYAYSPSLNTKVREFNLEMNNPTITNKIYAEQIANAFAQRMNAKKHMQVSDWTAKVIYEQYGVTTLPNYLFHTGSA
jgi:hypothetical protein